MKPDLKDIHLPADISIWPIAPAWWLILAVSITLIALALWYKGSMIRAKKRYLKQVFTETENAILALLKVEDTAIVLRSSNQILKKLLINLKSEKTVAKLHQQDWIRYLEQLAHPFSFSKTTKYLFTEAMYQPNVEYEVATYLDELHRWLKLCRKNV